MKVPRRSGTAKQSRFFREPWLSRRRRKTLGAKQRSLDAHRGRNNDKQEATAWT